jgi:hypothetical protein
MQIMEDRAHVLGFRVAFLHKAILLPCSKSGLYLTNSELAGLKS